MRFICLVLEFLKSTRLSLAQQTRDRLNPQKEKNLTESVVIFMNNFKKTNPANVLPIERQLQYFVAPVGPSHQSKVQLFHFAFCPFAVKESNLIIYRLHKIFLAEWFIQKRKIFFLVFTSLLYWSTFRQMLNSRDFFSIFENFSLNDEKGERGPFQFA